MYYIIVDDYKIKTYPSSVLTKRIDLIPHPLSQPGYGVPQRPMITWYSPMWAR